MRTPRPSGRRVGPRIINQHNAQTIQTPAINPTGTPTIERWEPIMSETATRAIGKLHADQSIAENRLTKKEKVALASQRTMLEFQDASERIGLTASEAAARLYEAMVAVNKNGDPNWWPRIMALKMWSEMHLRLSQTQETPEAVAPARLAALSAEQLRSLSSEQIIEMMMVRKGAPAPPDPPERGPYGRPIVRE